MELEELKREADKLGYCLVKKPVRVRLLKCTCGTRPVQWQWAGGYFYECPNCDKKSKERKDPKEAKLEWNRMIEKEMENENL